MQFRRPTWIVPNCCPKNLGQHLLLIVFLFFVEMYKCFAQEPDAILPNTQQTKIYNSYNENSVKNGLTSLEYQLFVSHLLRSKEPITVSKEIRPSKLNVPLQYKKLKIISPLDLPNRKMKSKSKLVSSAEFLQFSPVSDSTKLVLDTPSRPHPTNHDDQTYYYKTLHTIHNESSNFNYVFFGERFHNKVNDLKSIMGLNISNTYSDNIQTLSRSYDSVRLVNGSSEEERGELTSERTLNIKRKNSVENESDIFHSNSTKYNNYRYLMQGYKLLENYSKRLNKYRKLILDSTKKVKMSNFSRVNQNKIIQEDKTQTIDKGSEIAENLSYSVVSDDPVIVSLSRSLLSDDLFNSSDAPQLWLELYNETDLGSNMSLSSDNCTDWHGGQSAFYQIGNFLCLGAFLVPPNFSTSALVVRCTLAVAMALQCAWAALYLCAMDVLGWYSMLLLVNLLHAARLVHLLWPTRIQIELQDLYNKLFKPLKVSRESFVQLTREGRLEHLPAGHLYAEEELTPAAARLTLLLTGRLSVSCDSTHLHYVFPNQFVDSPEWEAVRQGGADTPELFQVTVLAEEASVLLVWQREKLLGVLEESLGLSEVLLGLIGKDVTTKLYSLTEQHQQSEHSSPLLLLPGDRTAPARSVSADALHTGNKGLVRSAAWTANHRHGSSAHRASQGNSPNIKRQGDENTNNSDTHTPSSTTVRQALASSYEGVTHATINHRNSPEIAETKTNFSSTNSSSAVINSANYSAVRSRNVAAAEQNTLLNVSYNKNKHLPRTVAMDRDVEKEEKRSSTVRFSDEVD